MDSYRFEIGDSRLALYAGEDIAGYLVLKKEGTSLTILETHVLPSFQGKGLASSRRKEILSYAKENGLRLASECSYATAYLEKHRN